MAEREIDEDDPLVLRAIELGSRAGAYSFWGREVPTAAPGMEKMRRKVSTEADAALAAIVARAQLAKKK